MEVALILCVAVVADLIAARLIPVRRPVIRFACRSIFFAVQTGLLLALVGSPLRPVYRPKDLPREFWYQIIVCFWWGLAARELISFLQLPMALRKTSTENKLFSDIISASIYVCAVLAMLGFVLGLSLQGLLATSGVIAIVLGLALQSTLSDVFSGISLSIEKPYRVGDQILLESGAEGEVIEVNWRSTHLRNAANDIVIVPNSAMAKLRIQNHTSGTRRYDGSLNVVVDTRNEPELVLEILKQIATTCPAILERSNPTVEVTEIKGDRMTYAVYYSTASISAAGQAKSQFFTRLYKRARPAVLQGSASRLGSGQTSTDSSIFLFPENEALNHLSVFESLNDAEKAELNKQVVRRYFQPGEQLQTQGLEVNSANFIYLGVIQVKRQIEDGRILNVRRLGPGDVFGDISVLTGMESLGTYTALTSGLLLELHSAALKPILESRPELVESLGHSAIKVQQFIAMFDKAAIQPMALQQHDFFSRIREFFRLNAP